ncbi:hypothetical protein NDU88_001618 [Pleurodeles waltl]|uniref:Uncharacterized protein n=1 Tax=Pleurodeles waltl TaxID=8319 RepID=A0AAV7T0V3_PLEWA|nr:hypothetical protein NDU88_001618 [Pleurodeles waltl]
MDHTPAREGDMKKRMERQSNPRKRKRNSRGENEWLVKNATGTTKTDLNNREPTPSCTCGTGKPRVSRGTIDAPEVGVAVAGKPWHGASRGGQGCPSIIYRQPTTRDSRAEA